MGKAKIAIACQGGGSQTAFTAGVLTALLENEAHLEKKIVSLSGTSGGAVCAALAWYSLLKAANGDNTPVTQRLKDFWQDNSTQTIMERYLNDSLIRYIQMVDGGFLPHWNSSPYSPMRHALTAAYEMMMPQFYDFRNLLEKRIDFDELPDLVDKDNSPVLILGAADVMTGKFEKFSSHNGGIQVENILASSAVPSFMKAVEIKGRHFWDGQFSDNPPTDELLDVTLVGEDRLPDQIWVIQINPRERDSVPRTSEAIIDRRNEMIGNASLYQDLAHIHLINTLLEREALKPEYIEQHHLKKVEIYIIQMSPDLQKKLDYASKLNRDRHHIEKLMADGMAQGELFLDSPQAMRYIPPSIG